MNPRRRTPKKGRGKTKSPPKRKRTQRKKVSARGRRFSNDQKELALTLMVAGMEREKIAKRIGTTTESLRRWKKKAEREGTMPKPPTVKTSNTLATAPAASPEANVSATPTTTDDDATDGEPSPFAPKDPAYGLSKDEQDAILDYKKRHPSYGPAQIRAQLKRFKGWRVSIKAIGRFLVSQGYELVHRGSRPKGKEDHRFEAPRPDAMWQLDYSEMRLPGEKLHLLIAIDDFSRFIVGHALADSPSSAVATRTLQEAMARHGKPEAVRTDRGGAFMAKTEEDDFARVLEAGLIDHTVGRSYHPQGGGKVEAVIGTIRRELWDVEHFASREVAETRLAEFIDGYNHRRAHMGIDGLTPADRYHGRADRVLEAINAVSRHRQGALALRLAAGEPLEEVLGLQPEAPMEVLRLVIVDGQMELRFCGASVRLGRIEP